MATKQKMVKAKRDPNIPVLAFTLAGTHADGTTYSTLYEILVAGKGEYITCAYNPKHQWSECCLIVRQFQHGVRETEYDLYDAGTWGWIGRLIANPLPGCTVTMHTPTDNQLAHGDAFTYVRPH